MGRSIPRISVLKLAEYMGANPVRRRAIVRNQWRPPGQIVPLYRRAMARALSFFRTGGTDVQSLLSAADELEATAPSSDWDERDRANSAAALRHLAAVAPSLDLGERLLGGRRRLDVFRLAEVDVSVRAQLRVLTYSSGAPRVGAIKLAFSKTRSLSADEGERAATLLRHGLMLKLGGGDAEVDPTLCQVVDLFREEVHCAPPSFKRTLQRAEAACEEIRLTWPDHGKRLPPPSPNPYAPTR